MSKNDIVISTTLNNFNEQLEKKKREKDKNQITLLVYFPHGIYRNHFGLFDDDDDAARRDALPSLLLALPSTAEFELVIDETSTESTVGWYGTYFEFVDNLQYNFA